MVTFISRAPGELYFQLVAFDRLTNLLYSHGPKATMTGLEVDTLGYVREMGRTELLRRLEQASQSQLSETD